MISGYRPFRGCPSLAASNMGRCVMISRSSIAKIVLAAAAAVVLPAAVAAQPGGAMGPKGREVSVPCCTCVDGSTKTASLNTGAVPWMVSGPGVSGSTTAVGTSLSAWAAIPGASWVGPSAGASGGAQAGTYTYTVRFRVPRCVIGGRVVVKGRAGGDNRVTVLLDGAPLGSTPGNTQYGFHAANFVNFNGAVTSAGTHTLTVQVQNEGGPTGMAAQATIEMQCPKDPEIRS